MSKKQKTKEQFELPEIHQLKLENVLLKMADTQNRAARLNDQFGKLAEVRNKMIEDARKEVGAPEDFMVNANITAFVPPPPSPVDQPPAPKDD